MGSAPRATNVWVKGKNFTFAKLLDDPELAKEFEGGSIAISRLAPQVRLRFYRFSRPVLISIHLVGI